MEWNDGKEFGEMRARQDGSGGFTTQKWPYDLWLEYKAISEFLKWEPEEANLDFTVLERNENMSVTDLAPEAPRLEVVGLSATTVVEKRVLAIGFVYNAAFSGDVAGTVTIPNMPQPPEGKTYKVLWHNPWSGKPIGQWTATGVTLRDKTLLLTLPSFSGSVSQQPDGTEVDDKNDLAFRVKIDG